MVAGDGPRFDAFPHLRCSEASPVARRLRLDTAAAGRTAAKRAVTVLFVVAGLVFLGLGAGTALADNCPATADNCVVGTESFESAAGLPAGWKFSEWVPGTSTATIVSGAAADGTHFLRIVSSKLNHARVIVPLQVTPGRSYRFQVMAKARGANANTAAAVLGVDGQYTVTNSVRTDAQWQPLDLYVKAGPQTTVYVTMGLGHFGQLNVGSADFDAVTLTQVSAIPSDATVADFTTPAATATKPQTAADSSATPGPSKAIWVFVGILLVVGIAAAVFFVRRGADESPPATGTKPGSDTEPGQASAVESAAEVPRRGEPGD